MPLFALMPIHGISLTHHSPLLTLILLTLILLTFILHTLTYSYLPSASNNCKCQPVLIWLRAL